MFLPTRLILPIFLASISIGLSGCGTIYSDSYSPRRSYFVPPPAEKSEVILAPVPEADVVAPIGSLPPPPPPAIQGEPEMPTTEAIPGL